MWWSRMISFSGEFFLQICIVNLILIHNVSHIGGYIYSPRSVASNVNEAATRSNGVPVVDTHRVAKRMTLDLESCLAQFDVHKNTIIRTGESQALGGKYLQGIELANSLECQRLCCETESCDVYVFEDKNEGYCYLFTCGPPENFHCKFTRHSNYTSALLTSVRQPVLATTTLRPHIAPPHLGITNVSQQEWELTNLKVKPEVPEERLESAGMPVSGGNTAAVEAVVGVPVQQANAADNNNIAEKATYNNTRASHCGRFQFTCHSGECIAVYNACDGIPQCEDGSDEGPECPGASANAIVLSDKSKSITESPQYQSPALQQQISQQQLQSLQQPRPQPIAPMIINNREDAGAWANRKNVAKNIQMEPAMNLDYGNNHIFTHKGGLQLPSNEVRLLPNLNPKIGSEQKQLYVATMQKGGDTVYMPAVQAASNAIYLSPQQQLTLEQQQLQQQQALPEAHIVASWESPRIAQLPQAVTKSPAPVQLSSGLIFMPSPQEQPQLPAQQIAEQQPPLVAAATEAPTLQSIGMSKSAAEQSTRTNRKLDSSVANGSSSPGDIVESERKQETNQPSQGFPIAKPIVQGQERPQHVAAVHEQYKAIHANLAMEFHSHDHDGYSERPSGAVLSLTLGLLVTAALAILIGCRMRTVGRPARRLGKAPYAHDADFLVNGMYL